MLTSPKRLVASGDRVLRYRRVHNGWQLWLYGNAECTIGTFLFLNDNATASKITWHADGSETILELEE
jgi:hypothetical protein